MVAIPILFLVCTAVVLSILIVTRHREQVMIIDKGLDVDTISALRSSGDRSSHPLSSLKWGMIFVGVGIAALIGVWLDRAYALDAGAMIGLMLLFGGAALVIFYFIAKKRAENS
jgi:predicted MFS family arabinose efflux permease